MNELTTTAQDKAISEITTLHAQIIAATRTSLTAAIRIGELLAAIKEQMDHGAWGKWAADNLPFTIRTATNYIRVFSKRHTFKSETVSDLSTAYRLLQQPKGHHDHHGGDDDGDDTLVETVMHIFQSRGWMFTLRDVLQLRDTLKTKSAELENLGAKQT